MSVKEIFRFGSKPEPSGNVSLLRRGSGAEGARKTSAIFIPSIYTEFSPGGIKVLEGNGCLLNSHQGGLYDNKPQSKRYVC